MRYYLPRHPLLDRLFVSFVYLLQYTVVFVNLVNMVSVSNDTPLIEEKVLKGEPVVENKEVKETSCEKEDLPEKEVAPELSEDGGSDTAVSRINSTHFL